MLLSLASGSSKRWLVDAHSTWQLLIPFCGQSLNQFFFFVVTRAIQGALHEKVSHSEDMPLDEEKEAMATHPTSLSLS